MHSQLELELEKLIIKFLWKQKLEISHLVDTNIKWYRYFEKVRQVFTKLNSYYITLQFHPRRMPRRNQNISTHKILHINAQRLII
jgi:hypothetical protein